MVLIAKLLVLALTAAATPILRRDATTVENDINQKIGPQVTTLNNDLRGFPDNGSPGAVTISNDFENLVTIVKSSTSDVQNAGSFSTLSGSTILSDLELLVPQFFDSLVTIEAQALSWFALQGGQQLILANLEKLNTAMNDFMNALTAAEPLTLKPGSLAIKAQLDSGFTTAIAAYSA
ncbi:hypothetical protein F1880_001297 [Penicillium rolfsii]|nr:hypothetical protein F1880_001297 [Penicillium rolfsii]